MKTVDLVIEQLLDTIEERGTGIFRKVLDHGREVYTAKCPACFKPDTIIPGDYSPISSLTCESRCIGVTGLQTIKNVMRRPYSGRFLRIKAAGMLAVETTPDHPFLICRSIPTSPKSGHVGGFSEFLWTEAKLLNSKRCCSAEGDYLVLPRLSGIFTNNTINLTKYAGAYRGAAIAKGRGVPLIFPLSIETCWLLGLYVAEGHSGPKGFYFSLGKHERKLAEKVAAIGKDLGYSPRIVPKRTALQVEIPSRMVSRMVSDLCGVGASNKKLPEQILLHSDVGLLESFLAGYQIGDGTVSKILALQLQLAYARLGKFARVAEYPPKSKTHVIEGRTVSVKNKFVVRFTKTFSSNKGKAAHVFNDYILVPVRKVEELKFEGEVWNLQTEDETYLVSNAVVHNCGTLHGGFKTFWEARTHQKCRRCYSSEIDKTKKEIEKVDEPEKERNIFEKPTRKKKVLGEASEFDVKDVAFPQPDKIVYEVYQVGGRFFDLTANGMIGPLEADNATKQFTGQRVVGLLNHNTNRIIPWDDLKNQLDAGRDFTGTLRTLKDGVEGYWAGLVRVYKLESVREAEDDFKEIYGPFIPTIDQVEFKLTPEQEYEGPESAGFERAALAFVKRQIAKGNEWGWCSAHVEATWTDHRGYHFTGDAYLGSCSYRSAGDFMKGGYYPQMKEEAYKDLIKEIHRKDINYENVNESDEDLKSMLGDFARPGEVTKGVCMNAHYGQEFYHRTEKYSDRKTPVRVRVSGKCKTWATRPNEFRLPVKFGLYQSLYITNANAGDWSTAPPE